MYLCCTTICVNIVLRIVFTSVLKLNIQRHIYDTQSYYDYDVSHYTELSNYKNKDDGLKKEIPI